MEIHPDFEREAHEELAGSHRAAGALNALEDSLAAVIPGLRILDRELELDGGPGGSVDFAGTDQDGRLVLVALVDDAAGSGDAAALAALDLLALARSHGYLLARHLEVRESAACELGVRCVLVAEVFGERLLKRLSIFGEGLDLFRLRTLRSARGARTYLVPQFAGFTQNPGLPVVPPRRTQEDFLDDLEPHLRETAELLFLRMQRMDSEFDLRFGEDSAEWTFHGRDFLRLQHSGGELIARVQPGGGPRHLDNEAAVESLVEQAFGSYVRLLGLFDEADSAYELANQSGLDLGAGTVLSADEIAAFQA
ncbi:MAG: hypothetical protein P1V81_08990 [Planctomycetota bacterium]|nr:hypothetical protein [Planctomycetota bacterium]